jgi:hypothetical protein
MNLASSKLLRAGMIVTVVVAMVLARSSNAAAGPSSLVVTAASPIGQAVNDATLMEVADSAGVTRMLAKLSPGVFKADTTGLQPPILIKGDNLFSVSLTGKGTANVNGITDLGVNQIYQAQNTNALAQFGSLTPIKITPLQLRVESSLINNVYGLTYADFKIKPNLDLFTTKFTLGKPGLGALLTKSTFNGFGTPIENVTATLSNSTLAGTFTADNSVHWSWANWTQTALSSSSVSGSFDYTLIPTVPGVATAYNSVNSFLQGPYLKKLKFEGKLLDSINLIPFYAPSYLNDGKDVPTETAFAATDLRQVKLSNFNLGQLRDYEENVPDSSHVRIAVDVSYNEFKSGVNLFKRRVNYFYCLNDGTGCQFGGDQQLGGTEAGLKWESFSFSSSPPTSSETIKGSFFAPVTTFSSVQLSDNDLSYFNNNLMNHTTKTIVLKPLHNGPTLNYVKDDFRLSASVVTPFVYDDFLIFNGILPASPFTVSYNKFAAGRTNETINWQKPFLDGSHQLTDFKLGKPITVYWGLPVTYTVARIDLEGVACNSTPASIDLHSVQSVIKPTATSASITVPSTVMDQPTAGFVLKAKFGGLYGQSSSLNYGVGSTCP